MRILELRLPWWKTHFGTSKSISYSNKQLRSSSTSSYCIKITCFLEVNNLWHLCQNDIYDIFESGTLPWLIIQYKYVLYSLQVSFKSKYCKMEVATRVCGALVVLLLQCALVFSQGKLKVVINLVMRMCGQRL